MIEKIGHYSLTNPAAVYDEEAMTSLELAGRTAAKVNECVEEVNRIPTNITNEVQRQIDAGLFDDQIDKYAGELKRQIEISETAVNDQVAKATEELTMRVEQSENDLGARLNNLLGSVTTGSTSGDAELIDARTDIDGKAATNLGAAVRSQAKRVQPVAWLFNAYLDYSYADKKITASANPISFVLALGENTRMVSVTLDNVDIPLTNTLYYYVANAETGKLRSVAYGEYTHTAGDIILFGCYQYKIFFMGLSPDCMYRNGSPMYQNITPPHRGFLYTSKPVQVDTAKNTITMQPCFMVKNDVSMRTYNWYRYGVYGNIGAPLTVKCSPKSGEIEYVCFNKVENTLRVVDRLYDYKQDEYCLFGFMNGMGYIPFDLHPSCVEFVDAYEGEPAVTDYYMTPSDIISKIAGATTNVKIVLGGDSITHGVSGTGFKQDGEFIINAGGRVWSTNPNGFCWANLFKDYVEQHYNATVTNKACTGTNSAFWAQHKSELIPSDTDIFILAIGTNDRLGEDYNNKTEALNGYFENLCEIVEYCHKRGIAVILCSPIPATKAQEESTNYLFSCMDANSIVAKVSARYHMGYVNMYNALSYYWREHEKNIGDYFDAGGLHPNDLGYKLMYYKLLESLSLAPHYEEV